MRAHLGPSDAAQLQCPSAQPEMAGALVFGLIDHATAPPSATLLEQAVEITPELLALTAPLQPTEVFRFSAPCQQQHCSHWNDECTLVDRIVKLLPVASLTLPPCPIRGDCRWFAQQGREACRRCPQIITQNTRASESMAMAALSPAESDPHLPR